MNLTAAVLRAFAEKGLSLQDVIDLAEVWEAGSAQPVPSYDARAAKKAYDREYMRAKREEEARARAEAEQVVRPSYDVVNDTNDAPLSLPPSPQTPQPPTHTREKNNSTRARASRRCPESWQPSPKTLAKLGEEGFAAGDLERALTRMRDHEFRDAHSDWDAVFRNWVRNDRDRRPQPRQANVKHHPDQAKPSPREDRLSRMLRGAMAAADRHDDELGGRRAGTGG